MPSTTMCSVFDDIFLSNFCLSVGSCSVADMMYVDVLLAGISSDVMNESGKHTDDMDVVASEGKTSTGPVSNQPGPDSPDVRFNFNFH